MKPHVLIAGGGIAGLTAGHYLTRAGCRVTVVEAGDVLGGRLATYGDVKFVHKGRVWRFPIEHGLHGIWRQYRNLRRLISEVGAEDRLEDSNTQELIFERPDGSAGEIDIGRRVRESRLPDALAQAAIYLNPQFLQACLGDGVGAFARSLSMLSHALAFDANTDVERYDALSVHDMIREWPTVLRRMFGALTHSGFFAEPEEVSLAAFFTGLSHYVLADKRDSAFDVFNGDSQDALLGRLAQTIEAGGGEVLCNARLLEVRHEGGRVRSAVVQVREEQRVLEPEAAVLALDPVGFQRVATASALGDALRLPPLPRGLPSIAVRLWYERAPAANRAGTGVFGGFDADNFFWLERFQRDFAMWNAETGGGVIECHLYGNRARRAEGESDDAVADRVAETVERVWPEVRSSRAFAHVQRNPSTHVAFHPGQMASLPGTTTPLANLALCGDWIAHPHPVLYLERACSTGLEAARAIALHLGAHGERLPALLAPYPAAPSVAMTRAVMRAVRTLGALPPVHASTHRPVEAEAHRRTVVDQLLRRTPVGRGLRTLRSVRSTAA